MIRLIEREDCLIAVVNIAYDIEIEILYEEFRAEFVKSLPPLVKDNDYNKPLQFDAWKAAKKEWREIERGLLKQLCIKCGIEEDGDLEDAFIGFLIKEYGAKKVEYDRPELNIRSYDCE